MATDYKNLFAKCLVTRPGIAVLFAELQVRQPGIAVVFAEAIIRQPGAANLKAEAYILSTITGTPRNLKAILDVGQDNLNLKAIFVVRRTTEFNLLAEFLLVNDATTMSQGIPADVLEALSVIT